MLFVAEPESDTRIVNKNKIKIRLFKKGVLFCWFKQNLFISQYTNTENTETICLFEVTSNLFLVLVVVGIIAAIVADYKTAMG